MKFFPSRHTNQLTVHATCTLSTSIIHLSSISRSLSFFSPHPSNQTSKNPVPLWFFRQKSISIITFAPRFFLKNREREKASFTQSLTHSASQSVSHSNNNNNIQVKVCAYIISENDEIWFHFTPNSVVTFSLLATFLQSATLPKLKSQSNPFEGKVNIQFDSVYQSITHYFPFQTHFSSRYGVKKIHKKHGFIYFVSCMCAFYWIKWYDLHIVHAYL